MPISKQAALLRVQFFAVSNAVVVLRRVLDDDGDLCSFVSRFYPFILKFYQLECSRASLYQVERVELRFIHLHDSQPDIFEDQDVIR